MPTSESTSLTSEVCGMSVAWPIVVVTGANSGIGFGICHRLLIQLSQQNPSDARPQLQTDIPCNVDGCEGLTLIMACRSIKRAEVARQKLYSLLDTHIQRFRGKEEWRYGDNFRRNLTIDIHYVDLALVGSIFKFGEIILRKYPYVSNIICNAGVASFTGIDWPAAIAQLTREPMNAVTAPKYNLQSQGERSVDGLGWVWQCNVFGHYVLYRTLQRHLDRSPSTLGARVLWMSSLEARPEFYISSDYQLLSTSHSYEASKYQIDLLGTQLDLMSQKRNNDSVIRHFVVQPGIGWSNIDSALIGFILEIFKILAFYLARWFGSPHHTIKPYKSAIAAVHLSLLPLSLISTTLRAISSSNLKSSNTAPSFINGHSSYDDNPVRFGSETDRKGNERVGITPVRQWLAHTSDAAELVERCETLYQEFLRSEGSGS